MRRIFTDDQHYQRNVYMGSDRNRKPYGFFRFTVDCCMTLLTSGLWLIWIFVREMRK